MSKKLLAIAKLARWEKPIGVVLLMLPCWWGVALATPASQLPDPLLLLLFAWGAFWLRGAGCTYNDIIDRHIDRQVTRTAGRPIAAGLITVKQAVGFLLLQMMLGAFTLYYLSITAIIISLASTILVCIYPFMKRFTWWPQAFLGLTFNIGILIGFSTITNYISLACLLLYMSGICWTIIYDTLYAHQDREDDALIGVKSTARLFGRLTKPFLYLFTALQIILMTSAVLLNLPDAATLIPIFIGSSLIGGLLLFNIYGCDINNPSACLNAFRFHRWIGLAILLMLVTTKYWF